MQSLIKTSGATVGQPQAPALAQCCAKQSRAVAGCHD